MTTQINGTTGLTFSDSSVQNTAGIGFRNRLINSAMVIDQRNAGASVTPTTGTYTLDRWRAYQNVAGKFTVQQSSTAPAGFTNSTLITSTSAYTASGTDLFLFMQYIEGYNVADLGWGTANAQTVTLSFWVRSSLTGTFGGALVNGAEDRNYPFTYTISSANTFEYKTITIAGDTSGTWLKTNGLGMEVNFGIGAGSTYSGTAGSWAAGAKFTATGATSVVGTSGATFYITGVQLEKATTASSFDFRSFGQELTLCQRYYSTSFPYGTAPVQNSGLYTWKVTLLTSGYGTFSQIQYPVPMRITGTTITGYNGGAANTLVRNIPAAVDITNLYISATSTTGFNIQYYGGAGDGGGAPVGWNWSSSAEF